MPELAEVEYYRRRWDAGLSHRVDQIELNRGKRIFRGIDLDQMQATLIGSTLSQSDTHGKQMCFVFSNGSHLGIHLGMTGKLRTETRELFSKFKHDHLIFHMESGLVLIFSDPRMFGRVLFSPAGRVPEWWSDLPAEVLSDDFNFERMDAFFNRRRRTAIKSVLLMQEMFPGIGNWMADEALFQARIRPQRAAGDLKPNERQRLYNSLRFICAEALRVIAPDWGDLPNRWLFNHRWKGGGQCPETGCSLVRESIGGRTTCWSPLWQQ